MQVKFLFRVRAFALAVLFSVLYSGLFGQAKTQRAALGVGEELFCTGSGHGLFSVQYINIAHGRHEFMAGPAIHLTSHKLNGLRVAYSLNLSGEDASVYNGKIQHNLDPVQLNFLSTFNYNLPCALSRSYIAENSPDRTGESNTWQQLRPSTMDVSSGIEFRINFTDQLCLRLYSTFNYYYRPVYTKIACLDRQGVTLGLGTSLQFILR